MASPQCENGHTRIADELLEAILRADLSKRELLVVLAVIRKTYGYCRTMDRITASQIAEMTGIADTHCRAALRELKTRAVIVAEGEKIGIQKDYERWNGPKQAGPKRSGPKQSAKADQNGPAGGPKRSGKADQNGPHNKQRDNLETKERARARGARLTLEVLPDEWRAWANARAPSVDADEAFAYFADYWHAQPGQKGVKADWFATWRNWIRREAKSNGHATHRDGRCESRAERSARMQREAEERAKQSFLAARVG